VLDLRDVLNLARYALELAAFADAPTVALMVGENWIKLLTALAIRSAASEVS